MRTHAQLWIARSSPLPFDVSLDLPDSKNLLPIISCFLPYVSRWRDWTITVKGHASRSCLSHLGRVSVHPLARHLEIHLLDPVDRSNRDRSPVFTCTADDAGQVSVKIALSNLPSPDSLIPLHLTSLVITETLSHVVRTPDLLGMLCRCPNLEIFALHGTCVEEGILNNPPPIVALPRLHTLILDFLCIQRSVLSNLHLPALRELYLHRLNMDFSFDGYHVQEPGDSDDEAQDFSQSPSSDHQTGMGLRKLISCSNPPLEVLSMDLADMRTKDFAWVFDRLPRLRQFSILGSDMSDSVIRLLKPVLLMGGSGDGQHGMRVRLPRLTTLSLESCQQFSGDALVDAVIARVHYTDRVTPNETLSKVSVVNCTNFRQTHLQELSWFLAKRFEGGGNVP